LALLILVYVLLTALAYRGLLGGGSQADLSRELEEWFFIPTETSPLVVVLLSAWLIYRRRERLERSLGAPASWGWGLPLLAASAAILAWSAKTATVHLLPLSLMAGALGFAAVHFGRAGMRVAALPALLLVFAVPLPAPLLAEALYRFQLWTAEASGWLLFLLGFPVYVSGDQVLLAEDHFQVIEGCSGMRSVQILTMISVVLVDLFGRRGWHALALVALAPFLAFGLNGLRVLALILNPRSDVVAIHNVQGMVILLVGLLILYGLDGFLQRYEKVPLPAEPETEAHPASSPRYRHALSLGFLVALSALSLFLDPWGVPETTPLTPASLSIELESWEPLASETDSAFLGTIGYRTRIEHRFASEDAVASLFVLLGDRSDLLRSPVSPKTVPPGSGWIVESEGPLERPGSHAARWRLMRSGPRRVVVHHWYEATEGVAEESLRALLALDRSPWRNPSDVIVVRLVMGVSGNTMGALDDARERLEAFERALRPSLDMVREAARGNRSS